MSPSQWLPRSSLPRELATGLKPPSHGRRSYNGLMLLRYQISYCIEFPPRRCGNLIQACTPLGE